MAISTIITLPLSPLFKEELFKQFKQTPYFSVNQDGIIGNFKAIQTINNYNILFLEKLPIYQLTNNVLLEIRQIPVLKDFYVFFNDDNTVNLTLPNNYNDYI